VLETNLNAATHEWVAVPSTGKPIVWQLRVWTAAAGQLVVCGVDHVKFRTGTSSFSASAAAGSPEGGWVSAPDSAAYGGHAARLPRGTTTQSQNAFGGQMVVPAGTYDVWFRVRAADTNAEWPEMSLGVIDVTTQTYAGATTYRADQVRSTYGWVRAVSGMVQRPGDRAGRRAGTLRRRADLTSLRMPYTPSQYWRDLHVRHDMSAVGQSGLPSAMNLQLYRNLARNLKAFLKRNGVDRIGPRVFEVGAGNGYWFDLWRELGAQRIDGCDLVPAAVDELIKNFGKTGRFQVADLGAEELDMGTYDFVACMNVLLHLTDDTKFERALANIARLVAPGGRLLLTEPLLIHDQFERAYDPELSSRARPVRRYMVGLEKHGLVLHKLAAGTAIGNNPIEGRRRWNYFLWRAAWVAATLPSKIHPANAGWTGSVLYHLDPALMAMGAAPSSKFALFVRPG
jgi:SAM-dependent methyltransferase